MIRARTTDDLKVLLREAIETEQERLEGCPLEEVEKTRGRLLAYRKCLEMVSDDLSGE